MYKEQCFKVNGYTRRFCHHFFQRQLLQAGICFPSIDFISKLGLLLTLLLLNTTCPVLANSVDPDQLASEEAN